MKGIVFNLLEGVVTKAHGEEAWDTLLERAGVEGSYTSLGAYPDQDLFRLVRAASEMLQLPPDGVVRWFARQALPLMVARYPEFFAPHVSTRPFLLTLNQVIHPEVRKLFPGADVPDFQYDTSSSEVLEMVYRSSRKMCSFALGLIEGTADHYQESVHYEHPLCMNRGDGECLFRLSFTHRQD